MTKDKLHVLCLDHDGGFGGSGGSGRSLYESIRHIDRDRVEIELWRRRAGPLETRYRSLDVVCRVTPTMPTYSALPRLSRNLPAGASAYFRFCRAAAFRARLLDAAGRFDLIHFNHEGLFLLARWLRRRTDRASIMHIRTNCWAYNNPVARWQARVISATSDRRVFITANEQRNFAAAGGDPNGAVIHNISVPPDRPIAPHPAIPIDDRFRVASLSNFDLMRGTDRLLDIAHALASQGRRDVLFVVAGDMTLRRRQGRFTNFADVLAADGLDDMFLFLGPVDGPEAVLAACDALIKPTRENNPWGRDIIEALAMGKPALSIGHDSTFVEDRYTGCLLAEYDPAAVAARLIEWADDRAASAALGTAGQARVAELCNGQVRAADLLSVWEGAAGL